MDIPYWSLVPALTDNEDERSQISAIPSNWAFGYSIQKSTAPAHSFHSLFAVIQVSALQHR